MLHPTSIILYFSSFVVLVFMVLNSSEAYRGKGFSYVRKTEEVVKKLHQEQNDLNDAFNDYTYKLLANNDLIHAMKAYREAYALTEGTDCAGEKPANEDDDDRLVMNYASGCIGSLPKVEKLAFYSKIMTLNDKAVKIDNDFNDACKSHPQSWNEALSEANEKLDGIVTVEIPKLKREASEVLRIMETRLEECFKSEIAEQLENLVQDTEAIDNCLESMS